MKLSDIFSQLAYGELAQFSLVDETTGTIAVKDQAKMTAHVNLGLAALYKRFSLKEAAVSFTLDSGRYLYALASTGDTALNVEEGAADFADDILKIEKVTTAEGVALGLNDAADPYTCTTPSSTVLRLPTAMVVVTSDTPDWLRTASLTVAYRAGHPLIVAGAGFNPSRVEIELPYSHLEALLLFIASRINNPVGMTNEFNAGNNYAAKYERECQLLESNGLEIDQGSQSTGIRRNGWV